MHVRMRMHVKASVRGRAHMHARMQAHVCIYMHARVTHTLMHAWAHTHTNMYLQRIHSYFQYSFSPLTHIYFIINQVITLMK